MDKHEPREMCSSWLMCIIVRKVRDSNPRYGYPYTAFRVRLFRPLRQLSMHLKCACKGTTFFPISQVIVNLFYQVRNGRAVKTQVMLHTGASYWSFWQYGVIDFVIWILVAEHETEIESWTDRGEQVAFMYADNAV